MYLRALKKIMIYIDIRIISLVLKTNRPWLM